MCSSYCPGRRISTTPACSRRRIFSATCANESPECARERAQEREGERERAQERTRARAREKERERAHEGEKTLAFTSKSANESERESEREGGGGKGGGGGSLRVAELRKMQDGRSAEQRGESMQTKFEEVVQMEFGR